jgi:hypothetical protein
MHRHAQTSPFPRARTLAGTTLLVAGLIFAHGAAHAQTATLPSTNTIAIPTYESVGLYWQSPGGAADCEVKFRKWGDTAWTPGLAMWYDSRDAQCRGSLVGLTPNTDYQVEFNLPGQAATRGLVFKTWANQVPVAKTVTVNGGSATYDVAESGTSSGYVVYQAAPGAVLDAANAAQFNVTVNASYVILRGLTLRGAQQDAIRIAANVHDVIIEDNDISNWGRTRDGTWGADMDSGIRAVCSNQELVRVTVQRNKIHDPRYSANSWSDGHPAGPQGITFSYCGGNHVFRHNEIYSTNGNYFNDTMGGEDNFSKTGFPNADSDIYGNRLSNAWDDGIESEGGNENVRIWGNYLDKTATGIATTVVSVGPVYIFRNVYNRSQFYQKLSSLDQDDRQPFFKSGSDATLGNGRRYVFHNTMLQAVQAGLAYTLGGGFGMGGTGSAQLVNNTWSKNNIYHLWKDGKGAFYQTGSGDQFASDLYNGTSGDATEMNGISGTPIYAAGNGWVSEAGGMYQLASNSPGFGKGVRIPNFNDGTAAPDVGAHQSGSAAMKFGVAASAGSAVGGTTTTTTTTPPPPPPTTTGGVTPSVTSLAFGTARATKSVTLTNTGATTVSITGASVSSTRFAESSKCGTLRPGASCIAYVTYYPTRAGADSGTLTITTTAPNSPIAINLAAGSTTTTTTTTTTSSGSGSGSGIAVSVTTLAFGTTQGTQRVTYTNNTASTVTFIQASMSSTKFGQKNNCGEVAAGASCVADVTYYPTYGGDKTGTFTMTSTAPNSPSIVNVSGG